MTRASISVALVVAAGVLVLYEWVRQTVEHNPYLDWVPVAMVLSPIVAGVFTYLAIEVYHQERKPSAEVPPADRR